MLACFYHHNALSSHTYSFADSFTAHNSNSYANFNLTPSCRRNKVETANQSVLKTRVVHNLYDALMSVKRGWPVSSSR